MRVLVATDAWAPQVNGVVRTLASLRDSAARLGAEVAFLTPEGFPSLPVPTDPGLRLALPRRAEVERRLEAAAPEAVHLATEGPVGRAVRAACLRRGLPFTTSYMTRFPEYLAARLPRPGGRAGGLIETLAYAALRRFHAPARATLVSTPSLARELEGRGFAHLATWTRGVDTDLFRPAPGPEPGPCPLAGLGLPRPVFLNVGRVAAEKNLAAFLALDLPGSKVVVGDGPELAALRRRFPGAHFLGARHGAELAAHVAAADVFVFPSRTDTYGLVQLEALACGVPVAAYPVAGPRDVLGPGLGPGEAAGGGGVAVLDADLRAACRAFALGRSWEASTREFLAEVGRTRIDPDAWRGGRGGRRMRFPAAAPSGSFGRGAAAGSGS